MPHIKTDKINLYYEVDGDGPYVTLINGLTMNTAGWVFQVGDLSKKYSVLRYDCRGQGKSDKPDEEYTQELHARDLHLLLECLGISKTHIIGLSNGGMIAQHFALDYPETLGALVLVDTSSYVDTLLELIVESWIKANDHGGNDLRFDISLPYIFSEDFIKNNSELIDKMREANTSINTPHAVKRLAVASAAHNLRHRVSEITCPTLIVVGDEDILVPSRYSHILHREIPGSELVTIKNSGHVPTIEQPAEFNRTVLDFLKNHDRLLT